MCDISISISISIYHLALSQNTRWNKALAVAVINFILTIEIIMVKNIKVRSLLLTVLVIFAVFLSAVTKVQSEYGAGLSISYLF
jgi:hypothetical protein